MYFTFYSLLNYVGICFYIVLTHENRNLEDSESERQIDTTLFRPPAIRGYGNKQSMAEVSKVYVCLQFIDTLSTTY